MSKPPSRDILKILFTTFWKSFRPRQITGNYKGEDNFGNKFYEIPANPSAGKRKDSRWFEPKVKDDFQQEMAAEWEAWLRGRRTQPPSHEELLKNLAIIQMKQINSAKLDKKYGKTVDQDVNLPIKEEKGFASFPKYGKEYETVPGKDQK